MSGLIAPFFNGGVAAFLTAAFLGAAFLGAAFGAGFFVAMYKVLDIKSME
jgi:hypothetical protein